LNLLTGYHNTVITFSLTQKKDITLSTTTTVTPEFTDYCNNDISFSTDNHNIYIIFSTDNTHYLEATKILITFCTDNTRITFFTDSYNIDITFSTDNTRITFSTDSHNTDITFCTDNTRITFSTDNPNTDITSSTDNTRITFSTHLTHSWQYDFKQRKLNLHHVKHFVLFSYAENSTLYVV
jgi:hypothetical protein